MVKFLHWSGEAKMSRSVCGVRLGVRRVAMMAIGLVACLYAGNANAQNWTGSTPANAAGKTVYLWNVGAKQFLGKGGRWGTEATISNVGTPFTLKASGSSYHLQSVVMNDGAYGCLGYMNGVNSEHDTGNFYVDRPSKDGVTLNFSFSGDVDGYQLEVTSEEGSADYKGTFYLFADKNTQKTVGKNIESTMVDADKPYSQWIIVTEAERKAIFEKAEASSAKAVDATFLMADNDFARNDNDVSSWETRKAETSTKFDGKLSWENNNTQVTPDSAYLPTTYTYTYTGSHTYSRYYTHTVTKTVTTTTPPEEQAQTMTVSCGSTSHTAQNVTLTRTNTVTNTKSYQYYNGNGYIKGESKTTVDEDGNTISSKEIAHQMLYGGDWTANIHGDYGVVNQTIKNANMIREGWYKVSCVGFTTAEGKAKLYASAGTASNVEDEGYKEQTLKSITDSERPATYVKASRLINKGNTYEASVLVYVGTKDDGKTLKTLSFGVLVDGAGEKAWTCFDNFQIEYLGKKTENNLVLDEDQTSVDYINKQLPKSADDKTSTLYLHRTVNAGKWNSIVLPVSLTVSQVKQAFGSTTHISAFTGANNPDIPGRMYFEAVDLSQSTSQNDIAIEAGKLYIIKPAVSEPTGEKMTFDATGDKEYTSYFKILQVSLTQIDGKDFTPSVTGEKGAETNGGKMVQFVGTYVAGTNLIPENSYVLRGNKGKDNNDDVVGLWFYRTAKTTTKGFRGWLQTINGTKAGDVSFSINGVVDDATGIDGLTMDGANKAAAGIYNLNGQLVRKGTNSTEGLAKGIYVVGGRKVVVK